MSFEIGRGLAWAPAVLASGLLCATGAWAEQHEPTSAHQQEVQREKDERYRPSGEVRLEGTSVQLGIGVQWGKGTLRFQGQEHRFTLKGLELVGVGVTKFSARGTVFNLDRLEDFEGSYGAVAAGAALGLQSAGGVTMRKGDVYLTLQAAQTGAQLSVGGGGLTIELERAE